MATIADLLRDAKKTLGPARFLDSEVLLAHVLARPRSFLVAHGESAVSTQDVKRFSAFVRQRREGKPVAYLVQEKEFYGLSFFVDERVLTPRPETETLIDTALTVLHRLPKQTRVCDVGTGSGCIAVTLAQRRPELSVTAVDISADALAVAKQNAERHAVASRVRFVQSDLLHAVSEESFGCVVANLPYLPEGSSFVEKDVQKYEPHAALFAGTDGLALYERLFAQIVSFPSLPRYVVCEFGSFQKEAVVQLVSRSFPGRPAAVIKDHAGLPRVFCIEVA